MTNRTVLILGARSDIARAIAHRFASEGHDLQLAARSVEELGGDKADIELRHGVSVTIHEFDALAIDGHGAFVSKLPVLPDIAVCAVGYMGDQRASERDVQTAALVMRSNFEGPASIVSELATRFEARGSGTIVGISSVSGERGRPSNYVYGSAKAGFSAFLSGLRARLLSKGVNVMTVLPGYTRTRMTDGVELPAVLTATPDEVAAAIVDGVKRRRMILYHRRIWRFVMWLIRSLPESVFARLRT